MNTITVKPLREEAIKVGFVALGKRLPESLGYETFREALAAWDVQAFCRGDEPVGMLMVKGSELHVAVLPEVRGKWLSKRLIRDVLKPIIVQHGEATTKVMPDNVVGHEFIGRLGFTGDDVATFRHGFDNLFFDPVTALVAGGAGLVGSFIGGNAAENAAAQQAGASNRATDTQLQMFNTLNEQGAPYRQAGQNALGTISSMQPQFTHSFGADDLKSNLAPNYQFQLDQGLGAVKNAGNLQTGLLSGNTLRAVNDYAQNYAGGAYQQAFNNYNAQQSNIFNRLATVAGLGQTQNQTTAQAGTTAAGNIGNAQMASGAAQAAGTVGAANALSGGLTNAASWYGISRFLNPGSAASASGFPVGE